MVYYLVEHDDAPLTEDGELAYEGDYARIIGLFSSEKKAKKAVRKLRKKKGFRRYPKSFEISTIEFGCYGWDEGFISYEEYLQSISHL